MDHHMIADTLMIVVSTIETYRCLAVCNKLHYTELILVFNILHGLESLLSWIKSYVYEYVVEKCSLGY